jgi:hypothetical protein
VEVNPKLAGTWTKIDMLASYTVVTNNFIATPRDGYYEFGNIDDSLKVDTYVEYAQSFIEYAASVDSLTPVGADRASTQNWSNIVVDTPAPSSVMVTKSPNMAPVGSPTATPSCMKDGKGHGKCEKSKKEKSSKSSKSPKSPKSPKSSKGVKTSNWNLRRRTH